MIPAAAYEACLAVAKECVATQRSPLAAECPQLASPDLLDSVWRHEYQRHIRSTAHLHRRRDAVETYRALYHGGASVVDIARRPDVNFSPYLLVRILLELELGVDKSAVGALVKAPARIPDERLRAELAACMAADEHCGPRLDRLRADVGDAHEALLEAGLAARRIPFLTEPQLRARGFSKTPDALLPVPMGVLRPSDGAPAIVRWIDSKATLGDPHTFAEQHLEQLTGYINRFGPGMVIYWAGFVDAVAAAAPRELVVAADLPETWVFPGDAVPRRVPPEHETPRLREQIGGRALPAGRIGPGSAEGLPVARSAGASGGGSGGSQVQPDQG